MKLLTTTALTVSIFLGLFSQLKLEILSELLKPGNTCRLKAGNLPMAWMTTHYNMLYQAGVVDNYPWTKQFLLRVRGGSALFLADKEDSHDSTLKVEPVGETFNDIETVYQGEDKGEGCYFAIIDNQSSARQKRLMTATHQLMMSMLKQKIRQQMTPKVVMVMPDNCVNKQQQAALAAKRSEEDRKLQQWVAQQSLAELCRRTGNC